MQGFVFWFLQLVYKRGQFIVLNAKNKTVYKEKN